MVIALIIYGVFWIAFGLVVHTKNFSSALCFKVIPFFTGLTMIICAMSLLGWVNL